jgi:hemoglobin/transferrin/lactoferrin receptor protein
VAPDFLKRVEVVRGPSSSLYGSDAIGGVVGFITLDPADLLGTTARNAIRLRATHHDANEGFGLTALGALRGEAAEFLIGVSGVRTKETDNRGDVDTVSATRTRPNPQKTDDGGVLAKLVMRPTAGHKLAAAIEGRELASHTDVLRLSASLPKVTWMQGDDNTRRVRGSLEWEHKPASGFYDRLTARVFRQDADTDNYNFQRRTNTGATCSASSGSGNNCYIEQDFFFTQETTGGGIQLDKMLNAGGLAHLLAFGIDVSRVRTEELRDARIWNQTTGTFTKSLAGDIRQADARNPVGVDFYTQPGRSLSLALQADF